MPQPFTSRTHLCCWETQTHADRVEASFPLVGRSVFDAGEMSSIASLDRLESHLQSTFAQLIAQVKEVRAEVTETARHSADQAKDDDDDDEMLITETFSDSPPGAEAKVQHVQSAPAAPMSDSLVSRRGARMSVVLKSTTLGGEGGLLTDEIASPKLNVQQEPLLHVPAVLRDVQLQASENSNAAIAAKRARASAQSTDFTSRGKDVQALRLHPRWMELVTKSNYLMQDNTRAKNTKTRLARKVMSKSASLQELGTSSPRASKTKERASLAFEWLRRRSPSEFFEVLLPHSMVRITWDVLGIFLILIDAFLLPVSLAWDLTLKPHDVGGYVLAACFWTSLMYWLGDIYMNFCTGFYNSGRLVVKRRLIAFHYFRTWFVFDALLVAIDIATAVSEFGNMSAAGEAGEDDDGAAAVLRSVRSFRVLRGMRLLRLLKMSRLTAVIEEASVAVGRQWLVLVVAIVKTTFFTMVVTHALACGWFYCGRSRLESGRWSWVEQLGAHDVEPPIQYLHAMQWILTPPAPPQVGADSFSERMYCIFIVLAVVVVLGSALSQITGTLQELRTINSEGSRKRREVRQYLIAQHVSVELTSRIMRFVDYKLESQSSVALDTTLLSPSLHIELHVSQRSPYLMPHAMFSLVEEAFPEVFASLCGAVNKHVFGKLEFVFKIDSWAHCMHITATGHFSLRADDDEEGDSARGKPEITSFTGVRWFDEAALFAEVVVHEASLRSDTFSESFSLSGADLASSLMSSPMCMAMMCEYAKEFLSQVRRMHDNPEWNYKMAEDCTQAAVVTNSFYLELHPDPKTVLANIEMDGKADDILLELPSGLGRKSRVPQPEQSEPEPTPGFTVADLAQQVLNQQIDASDFLPKLQESMPELHATNGAHALLSQAGELGKSESCCLSVMYLMTDNYEGFTSPQGEKGRLTHEQWNELQRLTRWTKTDAEKLQAVLVLLAIRSLGKSKRVIQQLPTSAQRPEEALLYLMRHQPNVVPSAMTLSDRAFALVEEVLEVHQDFNIAQMLQGENTAGNVLQLQALINQKGVEVFRFYILFLMGFMSGLAGGHGSRFMTARNAASSVLGMKMLLHVLDSSPQAVYWSFVVSRAQQLNLPISSPEDVALARLACLARVQDESGFRQIRYSWELLGLRERHVLERHFLADGIEDQAFVFEFLPLCVGNARENKHVSVHVLLEVLVDLIENFRSMDPSALPLSSPRLGKVKMINVDLSDMAEFILAVQNRYIFQTCIARCKVEVHGNRWHLLMTSDNWARTHEADSDLTTLAYGVKELLQRQKYLHEMVSQAVP
eukprot:TRINITY_DN20949_c0_g1_i1.p1 TRINITY_DN20949_c0_g1~~TRINITY_DN20949_c0_g1_i1.p1  ORF type:complete len:1323 (-),score=258.84 TRINITY_DN20949_c0_g1_i1:57-3953(-)